MKKVIMKVEVDISLNMTLLLMEIKYLGTAAAEGVPAMFCNCSFCNAVRSAGRGEVRTRTQVLIDGEAVAKTSLSAGTCRVLREDGSGGFREAPALLAKGTEPTRLITDEKGRIVIRHLDEGSYRLWESEAPEGFLTDNEVRYFTIEPARPDRMVVAAYRKNGYLTKAARSLIEVMRRVAETEFADG